VINSNLCLLIGLLSYPAVGASKLELSPFHWNTSLDYQWQRTPLDGARLMELTRGLAPRDHRSAFRLRDFWTLGEHQHILGVSVDGAWVRSIYDSSGRLIEIRGQRLSQMSDVLEVQIRQALSDSAFRLKEARTGEDPKAEVLNATWRIHLSPEGRAELRFHVELLSELEDQWIQKTYFSQSGTWTRAVQVHAFDQATAMVFPLGPAPALSPAQLVHLKQFTESGELSHPDFRLYSQTPELRLWNSQPHFEFPTDDPRMDLLQVYYSLSRGLDWFERNFGAVLGTQLDVKVHVGQQSNAAFYFKNRLRLGSGDGIDFAALPQDPSIVLHELSHAFTDKVAGLSGSQGEVAVLSEAFADFFSALILNSPFMGQSSYLKGPYLRSLEQNHRYSEFKDKGVYPASTVISGLLWDFRRELGSEPAGRLAMATLARLGPNSTVAEFRKVLVEQASLQGMGDMAQRLLDQREL
jgi:Zn-dependent metalloprotease